MTAIGVLEVSAWSKKEKGLVDMDNRVVIWEPRGYKGINGIGNNIVKLKKKITIINK